MSQFYDEGIDEEELKKEYLKLNSRFKYKSAEELHEKIEEYFSLAYQKKIPYTISGLALWVGLTTETLRKYEKIYGTSDFSDVISAAKQRVEEYAERNLYGPNSSGPKFVLENNFGWSNKQDINVSGNVKLEDVLRE